MPVGRVGVGGVGGWGGGRSEGTCMYLCRERRGVCTFRIDAGSVFCFARFLSCRLSHGWLLVEKGGGEIIGSVLAQTSPAKS